MRRPHSHKKGWKVSALDLRVQEANRVALALQINTKSFNDRCAELDAQGIPYITTEGFVDQEVADLYATLERLKKQYAELVGAP